MSEELVYRLTKLKLKQNLLRNKGYVLEGYPRSYLDCQSVFYTEMNTHDRKLGPKYVINLKVEDEEVLKKRAVEMSDERYADKHLKERIDKFTENNSTTDTPSIADYFSESKLYTITIEAEKEFEEVLKKARNVLFTVKV